MSEQKITIQAFTELAPSYEETVDRELRQFCDFGYQEFVDQLIGRVQFGEEDVVLDVASGTGLVLRKLATKLGADGRIVGLDITLAMLQNMQQINEAVDSPASITAICGSGMEMPIDKDIFDVVVCCLGTHHMDVPRMLSEMSRVLKPGGKLVMADVRATAFWKSRFGMIMLRILLVLYGLSLRSARAQAEVEAFESVRSTSEWRSILKDFGFKDIVLEEIPALRRWYPGGFVMTAVASATAVADATAVAGDKSPTPMIDLSQISKGV